MTSSPSTDAMCHRCGVSVNHLSHETTRLTITVMGYGWLRRYATIFFTLMWHPMKASAFAIKHRACLLYCGKFVHCIDLTHWGRATHICVGKLTTIGSDNGLSPERRQASICTNAGILLIGSLGTNFSEILIEIQTFSLKKILLKMSSAKCCSFRLGLNVLIIFHFYVSLVAIYDNYVEYHWLIKSSPTHTPHPQPPPPTPSPPLPRHIPTHPDRKNSRYIADDIFLNEKFCLWIEISLKHVLKGSTKYVIVRFSWRWSYDVLSRLMYDNVLWVLQKKSFCYEHIQPFKNDPSTLQNHCLN